MGFLDSVERSLEKAVNGAFARTFRSGVQPVEIGAALKRELEIGALVVDRDRVLAPNRFTARVSAQDYERLIKMADSLETELRGIVLKHAQLQGYQFVGDADVQITADPALAPGVLQIDAARIPGQVSWEAVVEVSGTRHVLQRGANSVGRGSDCAIRITDTAASRKHLEIIWDGTAALARDLGSTNGSKVEGQRFSEVKLEPGTVITIGKTALRFNMAPARATQTELPGAAATIDQDFWRGL